VKKTNANGGLDSCSCNGTETGAEGEYPGETDFTTKA
jgi:hypothetical protein